MFLTAAIYEATSRSWAHLTRAKWIYDVEGEHAVATIVTLFGIVVTLTIALGASVWGSASNQYVLDETGKVQHIGIAIDDETALHRKLVAYDILSGISLFTLFWMTRMKGPRSAHDGPPVQRVDRASVHFALLMLVALAVVVVRSHFLVSAGDFPGQSRPGRFVVARPYKFLKDGEEGIKVVVPYTVLRAEEGQLRSTVKVAPELHRDWKIVGVEGYQGLFDTAKLEPPDYEPKTGKLSLGPFIQDDSDGTLLTREIVFVGVKNGVDYTLFFRLARRVPAARQDEGLKLLRENPETEFTIK
jgi:hypothetical protein